MLENRTLHKVTTVGAATTVTLGDPEAGHVGLANVPLNTDRHMVLIEGDNYQIGIAQKTAASTVVFGTIAETLEGGVFDNTSPAAITLSGSGKAKIFVADTAAYHASLMKLTGGDFTGAVTYKVDTAVATDLDYSLGQVGAVSIAANTTFNLTNKPAAGKLAIYTLWLTVTAAATPTFNGVTHWLGDAPGELAAGLYLCTFMSRDGGTTMVGQLNVATAVS